MAEIINEVLQNCSVGKVNTLFVYAYNTVYGAFYPTDYRHTIVENGFGQQNILKELTAAAKRRGMKVVGVVPINNFKAAWEQNPSWRAKKKDGTDYVPVANTYLLSTWHPEFRSWLTGFYDDLLTRNPEIDGLEAMEPSVDYKWNAETDYNPEATKIFTKLYPRAKNGDATWLKFRAQGMTDLIGMLGMAVHSHKKSSYLVQTWPVGEDGELVSSQFLRDNTGLDLDAILNMKGTKKLNYFAAELMWQQWAAEYGTDKFPVAWTRKASLEFIRYVNGRSEPIIHLELTPFHGTAGLVTPTRKQFAESLKSIQDLNVGLEVYDYNQIVQMQGLSDLAHWY